MRNVLLQVLLNFLVLLGLISCQCKDETFVLSDAELAYQPYEVGDVLAFKNSNSGEVLEFRVDSEEIREYESNNNNGPAPTVAFCSGDNDDQHQERILKLSSQSGCVMEYTVGTEGRPAGIRFGIYDCEIEADGIRPVIYQDSTAFINGISYKPVYMLVSGYDSPILVTPEVGILSFTDRNTGDEYIFVGQ